MPQQRRYADNAARQQAYRARQDQARRADLQAKGLPPVSPLPTLPSQARWQALVSRALLAIDDAEAAGRRPAVAARAVAAAPRLLGLRIASR